MPQGVRKLNPWRFGHGDLLGAIQRYDDAVAAHFFIGTGVALTRAGPDLMVELLVDIKRQERG